MDGSGTAGNSSKSRIFLSHSPSVLCAYYSSLATGIFSGFSSAQVSHVITMDPPFYSAVRIQVLPYSLSLSLLTPSALRNLGDRSTLITLSSSVETTFQPWYPPSCCLLFLWPLCAHTPQVNGKKFLERCYWEGEALVQKRYVFCLLSLC
jgi:hypothetical protein